MHTHGDTCHNATCNPDLSTYTHRDRSYCLVQYQYTHSSLFKHAGYTYAQVKKELASQERNDVQLARSEHFRSRTSHYKDNADDCRTRDQGCHASSQRPCVMRGLVTEMNWRPTFSHFPTPPSRPSFELRDSDDDAILAIYCPLLDLISSSKARWCSWLSRQSNNGRQTPVRTLKVRSSNLR